MRHDARKEEERAQMPATPWNKLMSNVLFSVNEKHPVPGPARPAGEEERGGILGGSSVGSSVFLCFGAICSGDGGFR
jgi:hypothetical protein